MKKLYSTLSVDVVKFEAQDVITASGAVTSQEPAPSYAPTEAPTWEPAPSGPDAP